MPRFNPNGQNYANLQNVWHHNNYITKYNMINHPKYPFVDNSTINSPNPTGWGKYSGKNSCGCNNESKSSMVENMCSSCSCGTELQLAQTVQTAQTAQTEQTEQTEQISNEMNAIKATTKITNQTQNIKQKKIENFFSPITHDFCTATKGGKKLAF
jgi:L-lactate utilization protein LutB